MEQPHRLGDTPMTTNLAFDAEAFRPDGRAKALVTFVNKAFGPTKSVHATGLTRMRASISAVGRSTLVRLQSTSKVLRCAPVGPVVSIMWVRAGAAHLVQASPRQTLGAGDFALIDGTKPWELEVDDAFEQVVFETSSARLGARPTATGVAFSGAQASAADAHLVGVLSSLAERVTGMNALERACAEQALMCLLPSFSPCLPRGHQAAQHRWLARARFLIQEAGHDPALTAAELATRLGVSRRYLDRVFAESGITVARALWEHRLQTAASALQYGPRDRTLLDVALACGFADAAHFTRSFRRHFGRTPSAYRRAAVAREPLTQPGELL